MPEHKTSNQKRNRKPPADWAGEAPAHVLDQEIPPGYYDNLLELDPKNNCWFGFDGKLDIDPFCRNDRDPRGALREVVTQIVDANLGSSGVFDRDRRIEAAYHSLLGIKRKKGPKAGDFSINREVIARKAAYEFFWRHVDPRRGQRDWKKCVRFVLDKNTAEAMKNDESKFNNFYSEVMKIIAPIEDQLLFEVSAEGLPEWDERGRRLQRVLDELAVLGVLPKKSTG